MALAAQCRFFGHIITVEKALSIREGATAENRYSLPFECEKCGKPVRPRMAGDKHVAHFVHIKANPECSLVDPPKEF